VALKLAEHGAALRGYDLRCPSPPCHALASFRIPLEQVERRADDIDLGTSAEPLLEGINPFGVSILKHE